MLSLTVVCWEESVSGRSLCYSIQLGTVCVCVCGEECIREACHLMWGWVFALIWHQWNWVKGLFFCWNSTQHSKQYDPDVCVLACTVTPLLPHITPSQNPLLQTLPHLYIPSPVSLPLSKPLQWVSGKDGAISACVSSVCVGPRQPVCSFRWVFVCVGVWEKIKDYG